MNARTFSYLRQGAVASVPMCIIEEDDVAKHAKDTLSKILGMCSREEVESIGNVDNAKNLISHKQLILEQAERLRREQEEECRRSKRIRTQQSMAAYRANMSEQQSAQALEANRSGHATRRSKMSPGQRAQVHEQDRLRHAKRRANMSEQQRAQANEGHRLEEATRRASMSPQ